MLLFCVVAGMLAAACAQIQACNPVTMSGACLCGTSLTSQTGLGPIYYVSCAYMNITLFPLAIPSTTLQLYLPGNLITQLTTPQIINFTALTLLDLRTNLISSISAGLFSPLTSLLQLYLDFNRITFIAPTAFAIPASPLQSLFLGSNNLSTLSSGIFSNLTLLTTLHLENNQLTSLPSNLLWNTSMVNLFLHRNQLTSLPTGIFTGLRHLVQINLQINDFRIIPQNTFAGLPSLSVLGMAGNPSFCQFSGSSIICYCTQGYVGTSSPATFCTPIDCGSTILGLDPNAVATCTGNTQFLGTPCRATCNAGYLGNSTFTCSSSGLWTGSLTCQAVDCGPVPQNLDPNAAANCTVGGLTTYKGNPCVATCNAGYVGGSASYTCGANGTWIGGLVCYPLNCGNIIGLDPNAVASCTNTTYGAACLAKCNKGFVGGNATFTCGSNALWEGFLSCTGIDCGTSLTVLNGLSPNGTARCRGDTTYKGTNCIGLCSIGFYGPDVAFECLQNGTWAPTSPMTCLPVSCGFDNITAQNVTYTCLGDTFTDSCTVSCADGYRNATTTFVCGADMLWHGNISCPPNNCGSIAPYLDVHSTAVCNGSLYDSNPSFRGHCQASCFPGYILQTSAIDSSFVGNGTINYTCMAHGWVGPIGNFTPYCNPVNCSAHPTTTNTSVYNVSCTSTILRGTCNISCQSGYLPSNVIYQATCGTDGAWHGDYFCSYAPVYSAAVASSGGLAVINIAIPVAVAGAVLLVLLVLLIVRKRNGRLPRSSSQVQPGTPMKMESQNTTSMMDNPLRRGNLPPIPTPFLESELS